MKRAAILIVITTMFIISDFTFALDAPHNDTRGISCGNCHAVTAESPFWGGSITPADPDDTIHNRLCTNCHFEPTAPAGPNADYATTQSPLKETHSRWALSGHTETGFMKECRDCHDPHGQRQVVEWGQSNPNDLYLVTGTITSITEDSPAAGLTAFGYNNVTVHSANWSDPNTWGQKTGAKRGLIMIGNMDYSFVNFEILSADASTIIVTGVPSAIAAYSGRLSIGDTFGLVYGQMIRSQINAANGFIYLKFFDHQGQYGFADDESGTGVDPTPDGICQICHTRTTRWKADGTLTADHNSGLNCASCHNRVEGFRAACNTCHGQSGTSGAPLVFTDLVSDPGPTGSATEGAHDTHTNTLGIDCAVCHYNSVGAGSTHNDGTPQVITLGFYLFGGLYQGGSYDGQSLAQYDATATSPATTVSNLDNLTCSALYCHSSVQADGGDAGPSSYASPVWDAASVACDSCHGQAGESDGQPGTGSHGTHAAAAGQNYACSACHMGGGSGSTSHVNNTITMTIDPTYGGTYGQGSHTPGIGGYGDCTNVYCHGNYPGSGLNATPTWGTAATAACGTCHGASNTLGSTPASGNHAKHASTSDYNYACTKCHTDIVGGSGPSSYTIADRDLHVSGNVDWKFSATDPMTAGGNYSIASGTATPSDGVVRAYGMCTNIYCHSTVQSSPPGSGPTYRTTGQWGTITDCDGCHYSSVTSPSLTTGSHSKHFAYPTSAMIDCAACHNYRNQDDTCFFACHDPTFIPPEHANYSIDVQLSPAFGGSYSGSAVPDVGYGDCSDTYCHGNYNGSGLNASPTWGTPASAGCGTCHGASNTTIPASGSHSAHALSSNQNYACTLCHNVTVVGTGPSSYTIANTSTHVSETVHWAFDTSDPRLTASSAYSIASGAEAPSDGTTPRAYGTCSDTACHGPTSSPTWGADFTGIDTCTKCHGTPTPTATVTDADRAPPANLAGLAGTVTSNVSDDPIVGAHQAHLTVPNSYSNAIACNECHEVPASFSSTGHIYDGVDDTSFGVAEVTFGTLAQTDSLTPSYTGSGGTCNSVYCHGASKADGTPSTRVTPDWNTNLLDGTGSTDCGLCHGNPPDTGDHGGVSANTCSTCHDHVNDGATSAPFFNNLSLHINGSVDASGGDCTGCHATGGTGIEVQAEFERNSHHIQKAWADMTGTDCIVCHAEGTLNADGTASKNDTYHNNPVGTVDLYNADNRGTIYSIALSSGEVPKDDAVNTTFDTFCMSCHDAGGAAAVGGGNWPAAYASTNPFGESTSIRTNDYDLVQKNFGATGSLNVFDAFDPTGGDGSDADSKTNNHHAVRGQRYSVNAGLAFGQSLAEAEVLDTTVASLVLYDGTSGVFDDSTLHCNDCHSTGYSNHGSNNEYLLQRSDEENPTAEHTGTTYVCLKCHIGVEGAAGYEYNTTDHFSNASDYQHTSDQIGDARWDDGNFGSGVTTDGHATGIGCLNCHDGAKGFGGVHGFADETYTSGEGTDHWKRRFLPGSGLAYYAPGNDISWQSRGDYVTGEKVVPTSPNGFLYECIVAGQASNSEPTWPTTVGATVTDGGVTWENIGTAPAVSEAEWEYSDANANNQCYTLSTGREGGNISACSHHGGGTDHSQRTTQRPVDY